MSLIQRSQCYAVLVGIVVATGVNAQVSTIDSGVIQSRVFNDIPGATFSFINNYPTISLTEAGVSKAAPGGANRDLWRFSSDGTTPYQFQPNDYFTASMDLTLTVSPITPRKEAGWLFSTGSGNGDIQFIVNTDGHEVVQFGGISFYSFSANSLATYNSGDTITLGISYFHDSNDKNALQFFANGIGSPVFEFGPGAGNGALDIGSGSTLGGYFQIVNDPSNPSNAGSAQFQNISIVAVPEPSVFALVGLGSLAVLFRARRQTNC